MGPLYFRQFVELTERKPNYLDALQDELGIDPKAFEKNPEWSANMTVGKFSYNGLLYTVKNFVYKHGNIVGAMIEPMNVAGVKSQRSYLNKGDQQIRMPNAHVSSEPFFVSVDNLNKMLTQGMSPGGGAGGGMPMGGGGNAMLPGGAPI
jgi:hypothetical protein